MRKFTKSTGLKYALEKENIEWVGKQHRALDDAKNLAKIVIKFRDNWQY